MEKFILHSEYKPTGDQPELFASMLKKGVKLEQECIGEICS